MVLDTSASTESGARRKQPRVQESPLRTTRIKRGLTQIRLAKLAGMHRNSLRRLENDPTREVTASTADAIASALGTSVAELGLRVRRTPQRSIRLRQLTPEQRQIVDDILSLPPEDFSLIRGAIEKLRETRRAVNREHRRVRPRGRRPRR